MNLKEKHTLNNRYTQAGEWINKDFDPKKSAKQLAEMSGIKVALFYNLAALRVMNEDMYQYVIDGRISYNTAYFEARLIAATESK